MASEYGDVDVKIAGVTYTVRVGNLELEQLQGAYKVSTIDEAIYFTDKSQANAITFYQIALSRKHGDLTREQVCDLMDWKPKGARSSPLGKAVDAALRFSLPRLFEEREEAKDPKAPAPSGASESATS